ncbi:hypothetical protein P3F83_07740 [Mycobacteroides immunogenum]|uniref:hypothetical protein n=1 Tax=Mycobacteroides immunogenum TaxID=83262 RepID=UPI0025B77D2B|nr:hypothetical protein [Mycobacteroides immunogenum]WJR35252.1 hypothetical protein P3F83_07740 [Mycobacteroides immunogenum]
MTRHGYTVEGRRVWMTTPYGSPYTPRLKAIGAHWDRDRKQWWVGTASRAAVTAIMDEAIAAEAEPTVTVHIDMDCTTALVSERWGDTYAALVDGTTIVSVPRDGDVPRFAPFTETVDGEVKASGGHLHWGSGTVVAAQVPQSMADQWITGGWAVLPGQPYATDEHRIPRCDDCGRLARGGVFPVTDLSGISGMACHDCGYEASFA